ncbi:ubiquitin-specific protease otu1 [Purpureocillium takamizusanense]|uniref:Ubiquitin thioesterase OTU n=1 Tax=Purpureocillium takamizusanense TaxID=2060973 RepID=A0A9Q8V933_9HYPO|nr:ubiquitin-specific protease otu1 [Purpureocillium takamizusanense]UNI17313.1 ubiquitin-specific protease otu1 [Purpureocillium takamizusanense]
MRTRFKTASGTGIIEIDDDATVDALFDEIKARTGINRFVVKYGPPMAMKTLDLSHAHEAASSLGLHGETLTVVTDESNSTDPEGTIKASMSPREKFESRPFPTDNEPAEDIVVPWPEREGTLLLRIMPSDNSCLFTAFGGALPDQLPAFSLRRMMADYIKEHPDVYSEAVLGCDTAEYCRSIQDPNRWGGGIELSILSSIFDIQICTFDVQTRSLMKFGEIKPQRCILVYSGIHYDRVAFSYSNAPYNAALLPPELDRTLWPVEDHEVLQKTQELVQGLNSAHYYTDTEGLILKCDVPSCDWIGSGQYEGKKHAELTGHAQLTEVTDLDGDAVLRKCNAQGCDYMGQGDRAMRRHRDDTGHAQFSVIPDS